MGLIKTLADSALRDFNLNGVPSSGLREVPKVDLRAVFAAVEEAVQASTAGLSTEPTVAAMAAFFTDPENQGKLVYVNNNNNADDDPANGVYEYVEGEPRIATAFYTGIALVVQPLVDEATDAANFLTGVYNLLAYDDLHFAKRFDADGTLYERGVKAIGDAAAYRISDAPWTRDSVQGFELEYIPGVKRIFERLNGSVYGYVDEVGRQHVVLPPGAPGEAESDAPRRSAYSLPGMDVPNAILDWWVRSPLQSIGKRLYLTFAGSDVDRDDEMGPLGIVQSAYGSQLMRFTLGYEVNVDEGDGGIDDHNQISINIDARPGAEWPLILHQLPHAKPDSIMREWRSPTRDAADLGEEEGISGPQAQGYTQPVRHVSDPDLYYELVRNSDSPTGKWSIRKYPGTDGRKFDQVTLAQAESLYLSMNRALDGTGLIIAFYRHPGYAGAGSMGLLRLAWDGELTDSDGDAISADIWTAHTPFDPFAGPVLYTAAAKMRMNDVWEFTEGTVSFAGQTYANDYTGAQGFVAGLDLDSGVFTIKEDVVPDAGDGAGTQPSYYGGMALIGPTAVLACTIDEPAGHSQAAIWIGDDLGVGAWAKTLVEEVDNPAICFRPYAENRHSWDGENGVRVEQRGTRAVYLTGTYSTFFDHDMTAKVIDLGDFIDLGDL